MEYVFWQNIVSPHQSVFLRTLAKVQKVTLIVDKEMSHERKKMGWISPNIGNTRLIVNPSAEEIINVLISNKENTLHIFSGIYDKNIVFIAFKKAVQFHCYIAIMSEPYNWNGIKGILRRIREKFFFLKYGNFINFILAIGPIALKQYKIIGYKRVLEWGYFVEHSSNLRFTEHSLTNDEKFNIIYVGKLIKRKSIDILIDAIAKIKNPYRLHILGDGPMKKKLMKKVKDLNLSSNILFFENIKIHEVRDHIRLCDLLILPSKFDGWGAVVNEALMEGTPVICSDSCGASTLLTNSILGNYFPNGNIDFLTQLIEQRIKKGKIDDSTRSLIKDWSLHTISGEIAVSYFCNITAYYFGFSNDIPDVPWKMFSIE